MGDSDSVEIPLGGHFKLPELPRHLATQQVESYVGTAPQ